MTIPVTEKAIEAQEGGGITTSALAPRLQVGHVVGGGDQRGGAAEEGVGAGGVDDAVALALLDRGAGEADAAGELLDGQRLPGQRRLVDLRGKGRVVGVPEKGPP